MRPTKRALLAALCAALLALCAGATPALGATGDPILVFVPPTYTSVPGGYFEGPCGLAVDSSGRFYVSDYYHDAVDVFESSFSEPRYKTQLAGVDPIDGPCGLALDSVGHLYVNDFDRGVSRYGAYPSPFGTASPIAGAGVDSAHPTGVAVDPNTDDAYVDDRTYVTGYDSSGAQLMDGANPLRIGQGTLGDGYGLATDAAGRLYIADAADETVKVYDPSISKTTPQLTITGPPGGFTSLRQASLAVDRSYGVLYVVDDLQPTYTEEPAAQVEAFDISTGNYLGVLKYRIVDALPAGLAVDNSSWLGRVYVTSGNTDQAGVYAYAPGSQVGSSLPPAVGLTVSASGSGGGAIASSLGGVDCSASCTAQIRSGAQVTLSATPDQGSTFEGWSGAGCEGSGECTVTMDQANSVSADFEATPSSTPPTPSSSPAPSPSGGEAPFAPIAPKPHAKRHRARRHHRARHHRHHRRRVRHRHHQRHHRKSR